jgi:GT2 family glycosyltransferase
MLKQRNVYLNILNQNEIHTELTKTIVMMTQQDGFRIGMGYPKGKPITNNRNTIVQKFLAQPEYEYLMMIDSDIVPPPNILKLLDFQKDVITPLMFCYQKGNEDKYEVRPLVLKMAKDGIYDIPKDLTNKSGLIEVDATGTGCIIISRKVLETIKHPFENVYDKDGIKRLGNDLNFCKRVKESGFKVWVHLDYEASHYTELDLKELYHTFLVSNKITEQFNKMKEYFKDKPKLLDKILSSPLN